MKILKPEITYSQIIDFLKTETPFKFLRYGDGEIECMIGKKRRFGFLHGRNCDLHNYYSSLGEALRKTVDNLKWPSAIENSYNYMIAIQPLAVEKYPKAIQQYFSIPIRPNKVYHNAEAIHNASIEGQLHKMIEAFNNRPVVVIGPKHLAALQKRFVFKHIVVPDKNCWLSYNSITYLLQDYLHSLKKKGVVLLSCSMMAEVLIHEYRYSSITMIDTGSVFDPYCGVNSRNYHKEILNKKLI